MLLHPIEVVQTSVSGAWSFNTVKFAGAMLDQLLIQAASGDTTFDITITDEKSNVVYDTEDTGDTPTGKLNVMVNLPLLGIYTIACANASADEAFTGRLMVSDG